MSEFVLTFPLYVVVTRNDERKLHKPLFIHEDNHGLAVSLFTEELLAERSRDARSPNGEIWTIENHQELYEHTRQFRQWEVEYVAIDPHHESGARAWFLSVADLRRTIRTDGFFSFGE